MTVLAAGVLYFVLVFGAGFLLGALRTLLLVPRIGARKAELLESPVMLAVSYFACSWVVSWLQLPESILVRLETGLVAFALMLVAEFGLMLRLRKLTLKAYLAGRDPVSASVYYLLLLVFAALPLFVGR